MFEELNLKRYDLHFHNHASVLLVHILIFHTLHLPAGKRPLVVARGGFSGLFPESSSYANQLALSSSLPDTVLFCNLQLTKDGAGICLTDIRLDNSTNIALIWPKGKKTYDVNGNKVHGWFALDYTIDQLFNNISCKSQTPCLSPIPWYIV
jgi:glycerophosphoryl diester phosphodiesterase